MRSHGVAWAKLRIFGRFPPLMGQKKARWQLIRRPTAPQSEGGIRKATAVDRRFRRGDRSPSSDLFSSRWTSLRPQRPTSRHFIVSANQRAFALTHRRKPGDSRYMDTAERRKKKRLCFIEGKSTDFISNRRSFTKEKFQHNRKTENIAPKQVDFLSNSPYFSPQPRSFSGTSDIRRPPLLAPSLSHVHRHARTDTRPRTSRTQRVFISCLHPSPSPTKR